MLEGFQGALNYGPKRRYSLGEAVRLLVVDIPVGQTNQASKLTHLK